MNTEAAKAKRESRAFRTFIEKSGLPIILDTVESCKPPKPDLVCYLKNEGTVAFELVEICAEDIARVTSALAKQEVGGVVYIRSSDPSREVLRKKLEKQYQTEFPVELLCYTSGRTISSDIDILEAVQPMINEDNGQFRRIWLLGHQCHLVWPVSRTSTVDLRVLPGREQKEVQAGIPVSRSSAGEADGGSIGGRVAATRAKRRAKSSVGKRAS